MFTVRFWSVAKQSKRAGAALAAVTLTLALGACGPQAFNVGRDVQQQQAPGFFSIPAKVDILLAEDDTGSAYEVYPSISQQVPLFLDQMRSMGWDYHFATTPLTTLRNLGQVLGSEYDSNWGAQWVAPFPGALPGAPGTIASSFFRFPGQYTELVDISNISNTGNGLEPGFSTISNFLYSRLGASKFLRNDALLVILNISNGEDTSLVNFCTRADGGTWPCENEGLSVCVDKPDGSRDPRWPLCASKEWSYQKYLNWFKGFKGSAAKIRMYSAVAGKNYDSCLGGIAYRGARYQRMATDLGGTSYDVCKTQISSVLSDMSTQLQAVKLAFVRGFLVISRQPALESLTVTKFINGDVNSPITIPQSAVNGWTFKGQLSTTNSVYLIESPVQMNQATSGYAIQLNGTAKLQGADTAEVTYKPFGAQDSISE